MGFSVVCISSLQRSRTNADIYIYIYMELYYKDLIHALVRAEEFPWSEVGHLGKPCVACLVVSVMSDSLQACGL